MIWLLSVPPLGKMSFNVTVLDRTRAVGEDLCRLGWVNHHWKLRPPTREQDKKDSPCWNEGDISKYAWSQMEWWDNPVSQVSALSASGRESPLWNLPFRQPIPVQVLENLPPSRQSRAGSWASSLACMLLRGYSGGSGDGDRAKAFWELLWLLSRELRMLGSTRSPILWGGFLSFPQASLAFRVP